MSLWKCAPNDCRARFGCAPQPDNSRRPVSGILQTPQYDAARAPSQAPCPTPGRCRPIELWPDNVDPDKHAADTVRFEIQFLKLRKPALELAFSVDLSFKDCAVGVRRIRRNAPFGQRSRWAIVGAKAEKRGSTTGWTELPRTLTNIRVVNRETWSEFCLIVENKRKKVFLPVVTGR